MPSLLRSLGALAVGGRRMAWCFYLDGPDPGSLAILEAAAARMPGDIHIEIGPDQPQANAGRARRAAMALGLKVLGGEDGLLFSTDADSLPASDWITTGAAALQVADVAAGKIVRLDGVNDRGQTRVEQYLDRLHAYRRILDPVPWEATDTHHFAGGANMAIRSTVYQALGGFRPMPTSEDATLLDDASRAGYRVRRDGRMIVQTSSRRDGRAVDGLASNLRSLDEGRTQWVARPECFAWQARAQSMARRTFEIIDDATARASLGKTIGLTGDHVLGVARDCPNGEAFAMRIVPSAPMAEQLVTIERAEATLDELETATCKAAA